jgi:hypothetical protein
MKKTVTATMGGQTSPAYLPVWIRGEQVLNVWDV